MIVPVGIVAGLFLLLSLRLFRTALGASGAEGWLAGFFLFCAIAMPVRVVMTQDQAVVGDFEGQLVLLSHFLMSGALCCFTLFVDRVFRPNQGWAHWMTTFMIGAQIAAPVFLVFAGGHRNELHSSVLVVGISRALPFAWGFYESTRYYRQMRRRGELGLSDPVVTNRFALFAIWNGSLFVLPIALVLLRFWASIGTESGRMMGDGETSQLILMLCRLVLLGLTGAAVASACLSFFPPKRWVSRIQRRAQASAA